MPVEMLEHYTIRCASLERSCDFYRDVLGLTVGDRPNFPFKGYWMYLGGVPIVHLVDRAESDARIEQAEARLKLARIKIRSRVVG